MTCKYFDSGWCYAPENVEHNSKNGSCIDPLSCPYNKENKTLMTEKEHLECEIRELELEIENHGKAIQNLINVKERRKQKLEELQRQKPITLYDIIREWCDDDNQPTCEELVNRIEKWLPEPKQEAGDTEVYYKNKGWNNCIKKLKERLRE